MKISAKLNALLFIVKNSSVEDLRSKINAALDDLARGNNIDLDINDWLTKNWTAPFGFEEAKMAMLLAKKVQLSNSKKMKIENLERYLKARGKLRSVFLDLYGGEWVDKHTKSPISLASKIKYFDKLVKSAAIKEMNLEDFKEKFDYDETVGFPQWVGLINNIPVTLNVLKDKNECKISIFDPYVNKYVEKRDKHYYLDDLIIENRATLGWDIAPNVTDKNLLRVLNDPGFNDLLLSLGVKFYEFDPVTQKPGEFLPIPKSKQRTTNLLG